MIFSSLTFLLIFLPIVLLLYFVVPSIKIKNIILLITSLFFYAWGEPIYVILMIFTIIATYLLGFWINHSKKKYALFLSVLILILNLLAFKYGNFLIDNINNIFNTNISNVNLSLPVGISFYTFQAVSYLVDLYREKIELQKSLIKMGVYISLFPQLIAGPIVRYETIEKELETRNHSILDVEIGIKRFIIGLGKKVLLANSLALIVESIMDVSSNYGTLLLWIGAIAYSLQIFYDFSGYSDMAIGLGLIFGFHFLENFDYPYISKSITEFWHRWHISLSTWFKDYVYIPLGGSRVSKFKHIRNIIIVWLLTGLWHGASWNFVLWGCYFAILLILEKYIFNRVLKKVPSLVLQIMTFTLVTIGFVIFRTENFVTLGVILKSMFTIIPSNFIEFIYNNGNLISSFYFMVIAIILCCPLRIKEKIRILGKRYWLIQIFINIFYILLFLWIISNLASNTYNPFIYFRF